ncbi:contact-dependent growth inhibition system immunity protein [Streptosporangium sp. NPDC003464]
MESFDVERVPHRYLPPKSVMGMEKLQYLAQAYLRQDYDLEAEKPLQILMEFRGSELPEMVAKLRSAMERMLSSGAGSVGEYLGGWRSSGDRLA